MAADKQRISWTDEEAKAFRELCQSQRLPMSIKLAALVRAELAKGKAKVPA